MRHGITAYYGDFLDCNNSKEMKGLITQHGDTTVIFSDLVNKVNRKLKVSK